MNIDDEFRKMHEWQEQNGIGETALREAAIESWKAVVDSLNKVIDKKILIAIADVIELTNRAGGGFAPIVFPKGIVPPPIESSTAGGASGGACIRDAKFLPGAMTVLNDEQQKAHALNRIADALNEIARRMK